MTSPKELLTFPPLRLRDRLRLGAFVARCQLFEDPRRARRDPASRMATTPFRQERARADVAPLLDSKFDGHYDDLPATYLWARTRRMSKTRDNRAPR